jgi:hypothetical protein
MSTKQNILTIVLALLTGFLGGVLSDRFSVEDTVFAAKPEKKVIEAHEFRLVDEAGRYRGAFVSGPEGAPGLSLLDKNGKARGAFYTGADCNPGLSLHDKDGKVRAAFFITPDAAPSVMLFDEKGKVTWKAP